ncbi:MAG: OmpA family protein [Pseudomonadota bacterium]
MKLLAISAISLALAGASPILAASVDFPNGATLALSETSTADSLRVATGPYGYGHVPGETAEGALSRQVWHLDGTADTLQLLDPIRAQLSAQGYDVIYECSERECGGFDFRFAIDVASDPEMHVNLGDFRYLTARTDGEDGEAVLEILVSRLGERGFVQISQIGDDGLSDGSVALSTMGDSAADPEPAPAIVETRILTDLDFPVGSAELPEEGYDSLDELAGILRTTPGMSAMLVGHTDASGDRAANLVLSRERAKAVHERLVSELGVNPDQLGWDGVGPLSPIASNDNEDGRKKNRRVEVILTPTR